MKNLKFLTEKELETINGGFNFDSIEDAMMILNPNEFRFTIEDIKRLSWLNSGPGGQNVEIK